MKKIIIISITLVAIISYTNGQNRPFPQNVTYPYGIKPTVTTDIYIQNFYNYVKTTYSRECNGAASLVSDVVTITLVEAIGFGMLLAAYYGDRDFFDKQLEFYKRKRTPTSQNLMGWRVTCDGILDPGNATDGDIDVAFSLIVAYNQWGGKYLKEAKDIIEIMKNYLIVSCGDTIKALKPGVVFGGCGLTDIMYYTPAFFRIFADVTGDTTWNELANDTYRIRDASANPVTGLVPDWQGVDGAPSGNPPQSNRNGYYGYDACRAPWRQTLDYIWNGNIQARDWCIKVSNWANSIGAANIIDGYNLDGTVYPKQNNYHNSAFTGGFAVAAMCNDQIIVNTFTQNIMNNNDYYWFSDDTKALYLMTLSGNFWKPETVFNLVDSISVESQNGIYTIDTCDGALQMISSAFPDTAFNHEVEWSVINGTGAATISEGGVLTAVSDGTVTVRGTAYDGSGIYGEIEVTISNQYKPSSIVIFNAANNDSIIVDNGTLQLAYNIGPDYACDTSAIWSINNTSIASITSSGLITAKNNGTLRVIARANDMVSVTDTLYVLITNQIIPVTKVTISAIKTAIDTNETLKFVSTVAPSNATDKNLLWSVSDTSLADINETGLLTPKNYGAVRVYAQSILTPGMMGSADISIRPVLLTSIIITCDTNVINKAHDTLRLTVKVYPLNASNKNVIWSMSDTSLATILPDSERLICFG